MPEVGLFVSPTSSGDRRPATAPDRLAPAAVTTPSAVPEPPLPLRAEPPRPEPAADDPEPERAPVPVPPRPLAEPDPLLPGFVDAVVPFVVGVVPVEPDVVGVVGGGGGGGGGGDVVGVDAAVTTNVPGV
jgi:hypothetical protein